MNRVDLIRTTLQTALAPQSIEVIDDSHLHAGHAGARDGRGHFRVRLVAGQFAGLSQVRRHQLVYQTLGSLMSTDIHALGIEAVTPDEARSSAS
jgi:BolA family transcriptional regulator, general stress-responsive regulator